MPGILLRKLVDARISRLEYGNHFMPFDKVEDLEKYSDMTHGTIFQCNLSSMGVKDLMIDKASRNLARTIGFTQVLRATRFYGMNGHVGIPLDLCKGHKVRLNTLIISRRNPEFKTSKEIEELVFDLSSRAVGYKVVLLASTNFENFDFLPENVPNYQVFAKKASRGSGCFLGVYMGSF